MSNTLLPCPFCGGEAGFKHIFENPEKCMAGCRECDLVIDAIFSNECEALAAWNSRTGKDINVATNADRIRGMTDEELAKIITSDLIGELIPFCQNKYECDAMLTINTIPEEWCMKCALDWLKEEHNEAD